MKIDNRKYSLLNNVQNFVKYIGGVISPKIPANKRDLRIRLMDDVYELLSLTYLSFYHSGKERIKYLIDIKAKVSMLEFLFGLLKDYNIINNKVFEKSISDITMIRNFVYGWGISEEKKN